jgi:hypothetical protein
MRMGSVGQVKEVRRSDLDSHSDACVVGKEALILQDFDHGMNVSGHYPDDEKRFMKTVSAVLGCYAIPETGKIMILIVC